MTILRSYGLCALSPETRFLHIFLLTQPFIFVETRNKRPHAIANRLCYTVMFICAYLFIAVLKRGEVCPMPYALCPMHVGYLMLLIKAILNNKKGNRKYIFSPI